MGGHGGLNILPQKRWNVYNFDNREKVRKDEEAAAREEQTKQAESRRRDFELRLQKLRHSNNHHSSSPNPSSKNVDSNHINLFFNEEEEEKEESGENNNKKRKRAEKEKEKEKVVITADDMKYKLGYGVAGKGVKTPWYLGKRSDIFDCEKGSIKVDNECMKKEEKRKKSVEELRAERVKREKKEKERERELVREFKRKESTGYSNSRRRRM